MPATARASAALHKINSINQKKQRLPEVYGFVGWITSFVAYGIYLLWAYLPESVLHQIGITYYPAKYWATTIPIYICVTFIIALFMYLSLNLMATDPLDSSKLLYDEHTKYLTDIELLSEEILPPIADLPLTTASRLLYSKHNVRKVLGEDGGSSSASSRLPSRLVVETGNVIQAQSSEPAYIPKSAVSASRKDGALAASGRHLPPPSLLHPSPSSPALFAPHGASHAYHSNFSSYTPSYPASTISPYFSPGALRATRKSHSRSHSSSSAQLNALLPGGTASPRVHPASPLPAGSPGSPVLTPVSLSSSSGSLRRRGRSPVSTSFESLPQIPPRLSKDLSKEGKQEDGEQKGEDGEVDGEKDGPSENGE